MTGRVPEVGNDHLWQRTARLDVVALLVEALCAHAPAAAPGTLPATYLEALRTAGISALAVRRLCPPGVVTAGLVGCRDPVLPWQVSLLCRSVPGISHLAVVSPRGPRPPRVHDQLDRCGVGLILTRSVPEAVLGATLVVLAGTRPSRVRPEQVTRGAIVVNAGTCATPMAILEAAAWSAVRPISSTLQATGVPARMPSSLSSRCRRMPR
jgi:ornithine cyclodeaminase/alanine dehydrogenase-like protein (mu-crystallin family)